MSDKRVDYTTPFLRAVGQRDLVHCPQGVYDEQQDHLHCQECSPQRGIHCAYHCSRFLSEVIRIMGEQKITQHQAEDIVIHQLRTEAGR